jgi:hypothetical protein
LQLGSELATERSMNLENKIHFTPQNDPKMREARDEKSDRQAGKGSPNEADRLRKCFARKPTHAKASLYVYRQEHEGIGAGTP